VPEDIEPDEQPATPDQTVDAMLDQSGLRDHTPIRIAFLQQKAGRTVTPGPLHLFVSGRDQGGLLQYLFLLAKASDEPWDAVFPSALWARAMGSPLPQSKSAASTVSKNWHRIEDRRLIERERVGRTARVTLLREDGSGAGYTHPGGEGGYFKFPHAFWRSGPSPDERWFRVLTLPEVAVLLIASSHRGGFRLPQEMGPEWYGISADTLQRGFSGLEARGLMKVSKSVKTAPLAPAGVTRENRYTLLAPFAHRAVPAHRAAGKKAVAKKRVAKKRKNTPRKKP
jgi:hypothetical protein